MKLLFSHTPNLPDAVNIKPVEVAMSRFRFVLFTLLALFSAQIGFAQTCVAPSSNIIAWWPLDETSGTTAEDIAGSNPGAHVNGPVPTMGKVGGSLQFDGSNDYVGVGDSDLWAFGSEDFTIEFWANFDAPGGGSIGHPGDVFISHDEGGGTQRKWFFALGGGVLNFHINGSVGAGFFPLVPFSPSVGQWYHLALTREGDTYTIFVDGVTGGSETRASVIPNVIAPLTIGQSNEAFGGFMNGRLDEVSIYNRALTQEELQAIVDAGTAGKCKALRIDTEAISAAQFGEFFSQQLEAVSGVLPYSWSVVGGTLPSGVNLNSSGELSGTPSELGSFPLTVRVTDNNGDATEKTYTLSVFLTLPPSDIKVHKSGTVTVPGRVVDYFIVVENVGSVTVDSIEVVEVLNPPQFFTLDSADPTPSVAGEAAIFWLLPVLEPGQAKIFRYSVRLNPTISLGTTINGQGCWNAPGKSPEKILDAINKSSEKARACDPQCEAALFTEGAHCQNAIRICLNCLTINPLLHPIAYWGCVANCQNIVNPCLRGLWDCIDVSGCEQPECTNPTVASSKTNAPICELCPKGCSCDDRPATGPVDPNEKVVVAERFIQPDQLLLYPIHFENIGEIEAKDVFITDELNLHLDISTLRIFTPEGASFNPATRTVRWDLLNRNLEPGETDNVLLSIKLLPGLPSGTEIRNDADIQFEIFDIFTTNEVVNIIDSTSPICTVDALPAVTTMLDFAVSWTSTDAVGEVESVDIFVSVDGGDFTPLLENTAETNTTFTGENGKTYGFMCLAEDTAGNMEVQAVAPEAITTIVADTTPPEIAVLPNPAILWPPNHSYHPLQLTDFVTGVTDDTDTDLSIDDVVVTSVTSDEPENGEDDGNTIDDIVISDDCQSADFRAERQGSGNGRIYTIHLAVADASGNVGMTSYQVHVPLDQETTAVDDEPVFTVNGCTPSLAASSQAQAAVAKASKATTETPGEFLLEQNYPNPFNPETTIRFSLPAASNVRLVVYDVLGRQVRVLVDGMLNQGGHEVIFDASDLPSGTYLYRLDTPQGSFVQTMQLVK